MTQDSLFISGEGDNWYRRNQAVLGKSHDLADSYSLKPVNSSSRGVCTLLHKSIEGYYPEVRE